MVTPAHSARPFGKAVERVLFDISGLVQWYAYLANPSGIQRVMENVLSQSSLAQHPRVTFIARALGSDNFYTVDPSIVAGLLIPRTRPQSIARLRGMFARSMRLARPSRLVGELRAIHLPYIAMGLSFSERFWESYCAGSWVPARPPLRAIDPTGNQVTIVGLGDFWCHRDHVKALIRLKHRTGGRLVHLVHDLVAVVNPQWTHPHYGQQFVDQFASLAPHVDHWLATSNYVASQLSGYLERANIAASFLHTIPMGWPAPTPWPLSTDDAVFQKFDLQRRGYMLHVGTVEPRKNLGTLFDAISRNRGTESSKGLPCILVGRDGWRSDAIRQRLKADPWLSEKVKWITDATDEELAALYRGARFTVVPSFDEGWGLAVQESLTHGTPCIASPVGGIPEAGLDLATYVPCDNVEALTSAIDRFSLEDGQLEHARAKILARLEHPDSLSSWADTAATISRLIAI
jgi:glycosyltransferase involved in cell wall biosynthesis